MSGSDRDGQCWRVRRDCLCASARRRWGIPQGEIPGRSDMAGRWLRITVAAACAGLVLPWLGLASPAGASPAGGAGCSAGAHTLAPPGSHLYPETGNGGYTSLHTLVHLVYDATANRFLPGNRVGPHRPRHAVPDQLQPRLRAAVRQHQRGPGHDGQLGHRERPPGPVQLRPADLPGRPERAGRPEPRRARGVADQPGRRPGQQPAAAGLLAGAAEHRRRGGLAGRHPVPGQQARDHAVGADHGTAPRSPSPSATPAGPACTTTGTAPPRAGSGPPTAAS